MGVHITAIPVITHPDFPQDSNLSSAVFSERFPSMCVRVYLAQENQEFTITHLFSKNKDCCTGAIYIIQ